MGVRRREASCRPHEQSTWAYDSAADPLRVSARPRSVEGPSAGTECGALSERVRALSERSLSARRAQLSAL